MRSNKNIRLPLLFCILLTGCIRVNTDPMPAFHRVEACVAARADTAIFWNRQEPLCQQAALDLEEKFKVPLTLEEVLTQVLEHNQRLQASYEELGIAKAHLAQAGLLSNPLLDLSFKYDKGFGSDKIVEISVVQNILNILLIPQKKRLARAVLEETVYRLAESIIDLLGETKSACYSLMAAESLLALKKEAMDAAEASFEVAQRLYAAGNITQLELDRTRILYAEAKIALLDAELELVFHKEVLNRLMGLNKMTAASWRLSPQLPPLPKELPSNEDTADCVVGNSLDLTVKRKEMVAAAARTGIEITEALLPELLSGVTAEREPDGNWFSGPQIAVGIPLFDFGLAKRASGRAELSKLCKEYLAKETDLRSAARLRLTRLRKTHQKALFYENELVPLAARIVHENLLQVNAMQIGVFELLSAKSAEIETRHKALLATRDFWLEEASLETLLRGGF